MNDEHDNAADDKAVHKKVVGEVVVDYLEKAAMEFATAAALINDGKNLRAGDTNLSRGMSFVLDANSLIRSGRLPDVPTG